jgi:hypothetical protein
MIKLINLDPYNPTSTLLEKQIYLFFGKFGVSSGHGLNLESSIGPKQETNAVHPTSSIDSRKPQRAQQSKLNAGARCNGICKPRFRWSLRTQWDLGSDSWILSDEASTGSK